MILVVGASGSLGRLITDGLLARGLPLRVLDRGAGASDDLATAGVQPVPGDLRDPGSLLAACEGVDAVVTTANSAQRGGADTVEAVDRRGNAALVDAAARVGVDRFVFVSTLGASAQSPVPFMRAKGEAEDRLRATGLTWTILQPNLFMDVWFPAVLGPALAGDPVTLVGQGRRRHSFVAARDVAAYAVSAVTDGLADRETLVVGGPRPISWLDVVAILEQQVGHPLEVRHQEPGAGVPHLPGPMVDLLGFMDTYDSPIDMTALSDRLGIRPTPADAVIGELVASGRGR